MRKPFKLIGGDKIGIFTPSSPVKEPFRTNGIQKIKELGFIPVEINDIMSDSGVDFLARPPQTGFDDIQQFLLDPNIKALWAARGGYGSNLLLNRFYHLKIPEPKIIMGASDVTYLLTYIHDRFNMVVFYGPMAYASLPENRFNEDNLRKTLSGDYSELTIPGEILSPGNVSGEVIGGCLSNLVSLLGTPWFPPIKGKILLLEDVGERPYRLDRMLWQLASAGIFSQIRGLLLGQFPNCFASPKEKEVFLNRVLIHTHPYNFPILYDLPVGHSDNIHIIPFGIRVELAPLGFDGIIITEKCVE